jgi:large subunit ribosomal protein L21
MYAIVDIAGQQFKVEKDQKLFVHRLEGEEGKEVSFDQVLLIDSGTKVSVGDPVVKGASVSAKIITHMKGDKVLVFKKKRRKGYQKLNGHRQYMTQIQIESISEKGSAKPKSAAAEKTEPKAVAEKKTAAPKASAEKKPAAKAAAKPAAEKKPAAKKPAAAKAAKPAAEKKAAPKKAAPKKDADKK